MNARWHKKRPHHPDGTAENLQIGAAGTGACPVSRPEPRHGVHVEGSR